MGRRRRGARRHAGSGNAAMIARFAPGIHPRPCMGGLQTFLAQALYPGGAPADEPRRWTDEQRQWTL